MGMHGSGWSLLRIFERSAWDLQGFGSHFLIYMRTKGEYVMWITLWMKLIWEKVGNLGSCQFHLYVGGHFYFGANCAAVSGDSPL